MITENKEFSYLQKTGSAKEVLFVIRSEPDGKFYNSKSGKFDTDFELSKHSYKTLQKAEIQLNGIKSFYESGMDGIIEFRTYVSNPLKLFIDSVLCDISFVRILTEKPAPPKEKEEK